MRGVSLSDDIIGTPMKLFGDSLDASRGVPIAKVQFMYEILVTILLFLIYYQFLYYSVIIFSL